MNRATIERRLRELGPLSGSAENLEGHIGEQTGEDTLPAAGTARSPHSCNFGVL